LNDSAHILDSNHIIEAYERLCAILPRWQTYRNGRNAEPIATLQTSLDNMSKDYDVLRHYTLLDFERIPVEILENVWNELGRVKEYEGRQNDGGYYSIIAVTKPLLLMWGQTPAFDSYVRKHMSPTGCCNGRRNKKACSIV